MPIDYSRWKDIEISDDEDDTHPNVDTPSLFKWRHEARMQRMAEERQKKVEVVEHISGYERKLQEIKDKLQSATLDDTQRTQMQNEYDEIVKQEEKWRKKEEELAKEEKLRPWNVDTISHEGFTTTRINKYTPPAQEREMTEEEASEFYEKNAGIAKQFGMLRKWDDSQEFLINHPELCCTEAANLLTIQCLNYEIDGKSDLMEHVAHQTIVINYLLELARHLNTNPRTPQLIASFFSKMKQAEKNYQDVFHDDVDALVQRVKRRAKEKLDEMVKKVEEERRQERLGPGGLDPTEVFESLPPVLQKCFESRDLQMLKDVAMSMPEEEFDYHFKRCIDSGLWVTNRDEDSDTASSSDAQGRSETKTEEDN